MTTDKAQKIWKVFCGELIDNGVKDSEDVKQALATALREIINLSNEWVEIGGDGWDMSKIGGDGWDMSNVVFVDTIMDIADELEVLE